jgi:hypothetical protein
VGEAEAGARGDPFGNGVAGRIAGSSSIAKFTRFFSEG